MKTAFGCAGLAGLPWAIVLKKKQQNPPLNFTQFHGGKQMTQALLENCLGHQIFCISNVLFHVFGSIFVLKQEYKLHLLRRLGATLV